VNTLLSILDDAESEDVTTLDLDEVATRFINKRGTEVKPDSVKVYKSRVAAAIADFKKYRADPLNFKVGTTPRPPVSARPDKNSGAFNGPSAQPSPAHHAPITPFVSPSEIVFPIPIRQDLIVKILGLPNDLTKLEATRIANVIHALARVEGD
jgi:hypothetical protein